MIQCPNAISGWEEDILRVIDSESQEVLRITSDGQLFWRLREIDTDDGFRMAMLELKDALIHNMGFTGITRKSA